MPVCALSNARHLKHEANSWTLISINDSRGHLLPLMTTNSTHRV